MNPSDFEVLAERFSQRLADIKLDKALTEYDDYDMPNLMDIAGKVLYDAIRSNPTKLGKIPKWFRKEPKGKSVHDGHICYGWDLYWLLAIKWLARNRPKTLITNPSLIPMISLEKYSGAILSIYDFFRYECRFHQKTEKKAWRQIARASEDACSYLASISIEPSTVQEKDIWEGISPGMKKAIQDYEKESQEKRPKRKRLLVENFCRERGGLDTAIFRSERDKVRQRKTRSLKNNQ